MCISTARVTMKYEGIHDVSVCMQKFVNIKCERNGRIAQCKMRVSTSWHVPITVDAMACVWRVPGPDLSQPQEAPITARLCQVRPS